MSVVRFLEPLIAQETNGAPVSNSTTPTSLLPLAAKYTLAQNFFILGRELRLRAAGRVSTDASTPGTVTFDVRFGSIVVFTAGASPTLSASQDIVTWTLDIDLTCRIIGAAATVLGTGTLVTQALTTSIVALPATAPAAGTVFDSTGVATVDLFATWSALGSGNSIVCYQYSLWAPN